MFDRELDASTVNANTFVLEASGGDATFGDGNETPVTAGAITVSANGMTATFDGGGAALGDDIYRVLLLGEGASFIMDLDANALDGEFDGTFPSGDGVQGGDFEAEFTIMTTGATGPTLDEIQANVFTPICSTCHTGPAGDTLPAGMDLSDADASFANLVGVASIQEPTLSRVEPGDPDASYLVHKIEGTASTGEQMPLGLPPLDSRFHVLAGQFFLPYGLRFQDDTAFVRQATGTNFSSPDRGVQVGYEAGPWSTQLSLTNGTGGGAEIDSGKQASWVAQYVREGWRVGASVNFNDADAGDRAMQGLFFGIRTGPVVWLGEADLIRDDSPDGGEQDALAGYVEANWLLLDGHNLKLAYDYFDPDDDLDEDHAVRYSLVWEYVPIQFLQLRTGARFYDGPPQDGFLNRDEYFVEIHAFP